MVYIGLVWLVKYRWPGNERESQKKPSYSTSYCLSKKCNFKAHNIKKIAGKISVRKCLHISSTLRIQTISQMTKICAAAAHLASEIMKH